MEVTRGVHIETLITMWNILCIHIPIYIESEELYIAAKYMWLPTYRSGGGGSSATNSEVSLLTGDEGPRGELALCL